jgi:hypothetical protein
MQDCKKDKEGRGREGREGKVRGGERGGERGGRGRVRGSSQESRVHLDHVVQVLETEHGVGVVLGHLQDYEVASYLFEVQALLG